MAEIINDSDIDILDSVEAEKAREGEDVRLIERYIHKVVEDEETVQNTNPTDVLAAVWEAVEEDEKSV